MNSRRISVGALVALVATGLFLTLVTTGLLMSSQTVPTSGTISAVNVGVYSDSGCTLNLTSISWGTMSPGNSTTRTIYVKNTGTLPVTLTMTTSTWSPASASTYLSLAWNRESYVLAVGSSVAATLTLTASSSAGNITSYTFNIVITGTE
jgi:hypothetical protein